MRHLSITEGWELKERDPALPLPDDFATPAGWVPAPVPGTVHEALLAAGRIPDPCYGRNELEVQWVGAADWLYRCSFALSPAEAAEPAALCLDGLDTIATVYLNGAEVLASDNMFVPRRVAVTGLLRAGANTLQISFASALRHGQALEAQHGRRPSWNTDPSRIYVRKAQYHYGWDWGPCLITAGPWRAVRLELGAARIAELHCPAEVAPDLARATLPVRVALDGGADSLAGMQVRLRLLGPGGEPAAEATLPAGPELSHSFAVERPALWWPAGHGPQPLYRLSAALLSGDTPVDERALTLGLRRLRVVQEPVAGEPGTSFYFEVNGRPLFAGGANWIPADNLTPRISRETYRRLLSAAAEANMVMLRIWGGGIYEDEAFYELCDELGLLVWQDFMFACGVYPAHPEFLASIRAEAEAQVRRLRHHACLALWCGNNEDYQIAGDNGLYDLDSPPEENPTFPGRMIYERLLPEVCAALDPARLYWPGSPYGGKRGNDPTFGDRHTWDVWHAGMAPYQRYGQFAGRLVSEFGMQGAPAPETLLAVLPPGEGWPQSRTMDHHNKAPDGPKRLAAYLAENLRATDQGLATYCYQTQLLQAEALSHAYRAWRRRWAGPGRYAVGGALVWQLDDCWPVVSWAVIDSALRPKAGYYAIRRELAPLALGLAAAGDEAAVWAVNATPEPVVATLEVRAVSLAGEVEGLASREVTVPALGAAELGSYGPAGGRVVAARLLAGGRVLARASLWPEPLKYLELPEPGLVLTRLEGERVELRCARPAKGVWLAAGDGVAWEDNGLDLLPDEPRVLAAPGLGERPIAARWLTSEAWGEVG